MEESPNWDDWVQALMSMSHSFRESFDEVEAIHIDDNKDFWASQKKLLDQLDNEADSVIEGFLGMLELDSDMEQMQEIKGVVAQSGGRKNVRFDDAPVYLDAEELGADEINGRVVDMESVGADEEKFQADSTKVEALNGFFELGFSDIWGYLNVVNQLEEALKFLAENCSVGTQWLEDVMDDSLILNEKYDAEDSKANEVASASPLIGKKNIDTEEANLFCLDQFLTEVKKGKKAMGRILLKEGVVIDWDAWKRLIRSVLE